MTNSLAMLNPEAEGQRPGPALITSSEGALIFEKIKPGPKMVPSVQHDDRLPTWQALLRSRVRHLWPQHG
jgi:hypothetical protein